MTANTVMSDTLDSFRQGIEEFKAGNIDSAIQHLEAATKVDHQNYKAFNYLGVAYAAKDRYNAAIGAFKTAEQIAPNVAAIHYNIAQAYEASGILAEAEYEYERAVELDANHVRAQNALSRLKQRLHHV